ncbi:hypothetical protein [Marinimicrobium alkaliphilum]|uniref:hypothetical protein n=1 Tax=Marinimicrobium alkaliphilum TaxID=2202654 RepID=UPI0013004B83|nr:hypothetical protein [Marinimicrobium alkaliphilum]
MIQSLALLVAGLIMLFFAPEHLYALWLSGLIALAAQTFWIWRTLRTYGDPRSSAYLAGATAGLIGKWVIISVGLVLLWQRQPEFSVAVSFITVFGLNTLAALAAPILISRPR